MLFQMGFNHSNLLISKALTKQQAFTKTLSSAHAVCHPVSLVCWIPPLENFFKINWDAACDSKLNKIGLGVNACDFISNVVGALRRPLPFFKKPHTAQALAVL